MGDWVTIHDVAERAGVSYSTVSLALRDDPRVAAATKERVRAAAAELGYRPHVAFAALGRRRNRSSREGHPTVAVAVVAPDERPLLGRKPEFDALEQELTRRGYMLSRLTRAELGRTPARLLRARGIGAVVVVAPVANLDPHVEFRDLAVVMLGGAPEPLPFYTVRSGYFHAAQQLLRELWSRGYRRIGLAPLSHAPALSDDRERLGGLLAAYFQVAQCPPAIPPCVAPISRYDDFLAWYDRHRPDVIAGFNIAQIFYLARVGVSVPGDVSFAALAQHVMDEVTTGMMHQPEDMATAVANLIEHQVHHGIRGPQRHVTEVLVPLRWIERGTLRLLPLEPASAPREPSA